MQIEKNKDLEELELENKEEIMKKKEEIVATTWLSERQTELYLLYNSDQFDTMKEVAEKLEIRADTAYKAWRDIKDKISKSRSTTELEVGRDGRN